MPVLPQGYSSVSSPLFETDENPDPINEIFGSGSIQVTRVDNSVIISDGATGGALTVVSDDGTQIATIEESDTGNLFFDNKTGTTGPNGTTSITLIPGVGSGVLISTTPSDLNNRLGLAISRDDTPTPLLFSQVLSSDGALIMTGGSTEVRISQSTLNPPGLGPASLTLENQNDVSYRWYNSDATSGGLTQDQLELWSYDGPTDTQLLTLTKLGNMSIAGTLDINANTTVNNSDLFITASTGGGSVYADIAVKASQFIASSASPLFGAFTLNASGTFGVSTGLVNIGSSPVIIASVDLAGGNPVPTGIIGTEFVSTNQFGIRSSAGVSDAGVKGYFMCIPRL